MAISSWVHYTTFFAESALSFYFIDTVFAVLALGRTTNFCKAVKIPRAGESMFV